MPINLKSIVAMIDQLEVAGPYAASAPLLANAMLRNLARNKPEYLKRYIISQNQMLGALAKLEIQPDIYPDWMRNDGFKAWMWGTVALAADMAQDDKTLGLAKKTLISLLAKQAEKDDHVTFFTWAWGFRACLNQTEYKVSCQQIKKGGEQLTHIYQELKTQSAKADALWTWIMNLLAAAKTNDQNDYNEFKNKIMGIDNTQSVIESLITGLSLRSSELNHFQSNDFLALALAMVCHATAMMGDQAIFHEAFKATQAAITGAKQTRANAEYILAVLYFQLALATAP